MTATQISRREFFVRTGTAAAATAAAVALGAGPAFGQDTKGDTLPTYALEPNGGACNACRQHAKNKVFGTNDAAERFRAHKGCRCTTSGGQALSPEVYAAVFPEPDGAADRRDPRTAELLDKGTIDGTQVPIVAYTAPVLLLAAGGGVWWWMKHRDRDVEPAVADRGDWK
jgi:hypothetical protein